MMFFLTCKCLTLVLGTAPAYSQEAKSIPSPHMAFAVKLGMSEDGAVTSEWIEAIRQRYDEEVLAAILASKKRLSEEEALWAGLVKRKVSTWVSIIDSLQIPGDLKKQMTKLMGNKPLPMFPSQNWQFRRAGLHRPHHRRGGGSVVGSSHQAGNAAQDHREAPGWRNRAGRRGVVLHLSLSYAIINRGENF